MFWKQFFPTYFFFCCFGWLRESISKLFRKQSFCQEEDFYGYLFCYGRKKIIFLKWELKRMIEKTTEKKSCSKWKKSAYNIEITKSTPALSRSGNHAIWHVVENWVSDLIYVRIALSSVHVSFEVPFKGGNTLEFNEIWSIYERNKRGMKKLSHHQFVWHSSACRSVLWVDRNRFVVQLFRFILKF